MSERIEFYKNRSIGERLSVAFDFLRQNWKVLYKNILMGGLPIAIIMGYLIAQVTYARAVIAFDISHFLLFYFLLLLVSFINSIYLYSMTGAVLFHYDRKLLTETTGWNQLKGAFFRFAGKTALITILVSIPILIVVVIFAALIGVSASFSLSGLQGGAFISILLFIFLLFGLILVFAPFLSIVYFPAYFSGKTSAESISSAFKLGFKNWGSLFVAIILSVILLIIISIFFSLPFEIVMIISQGQVSILFYIFAILSAIGTLLLYPIVTVIFAFQYFSIVEKDEGVSLQSRVDEFENL